MDEKFTLGKTGKVRYKVVLCGVRDVRDALCDKKISLPDQRSGVLNLSQQPRFLTLLPLRMQIKTLLSEYLRRNRGVFLFLSCFVFLLSFYANCSYFFKSPKQLAFFPPFVEGVNLNYNKHLGAEYYFIAQALAAGKGFSNPFQVDTGPTAWMPPLYPFFLSLLITLFHSTLSVACIIVFLKNVVLVVVGLVIYGIAQRTASAIRAEYAVAVYIILLLNDFRLFFQTTHDTWLLLLFITSIFPLAVFLRRQGSTLATACIWGLVGGLSMLASPVVGIVWCALWLAVLVTKKNVRMQFVSLSVCLVLFSPWVMRNYAVFGKFIVMKSNLFFDAYFVNYELEKDGLIDGPTFLEKHPVWRAQEDPESLYRKQGEVRFLETYKKKFFDELKKDPYTYLRNIKNRLCAALFIYYPLDDCEQALAGRSIIHALPFLGFLSLLFFKGYRGSDYMKVAMVMCSLYLIPYVAVNYYVRYAIPLTPLKVLFVFWGAALIVTRWHMLFSKQPS